ncbi:MAG: hypothetical protein ACRDE2_02950, partial [Chitinophagaceae bacterium]
MKILNNLRYYSNLYFHGHSVGGTNPSLLDAMACRCLIVAHNNEFNKEVLGKNAYYFEKKSDVSFLIELNPTKEDHKHFLDQNIHKIKKQYNWNIIVEKIEEDIIKVRKDHVVHSSEIYHEHRF